MKRHASLVLGLLALSSCCCTVAPPEDYALLPLPEKTVEESVDAVKQGDGIFLSAEEAGKLARNLETLRAERDALRRVIEKYNEWAKEQSGGP